MVEVTSYDASNGAVSQVAIDEAPFGAKVRKRLVRQAVLHYAAARRLGTHSTLTRAEVNYNERKPWRQKGTGRARSGDFSSPIWRGGGIVFGPKPRSYATGLTRRMRLEALRSALLGKLRDGELRLVENLRFEKPRTKAAIEVLAKVGAADGRALLVIAERGENLFRSFRNLRSVSIVMGSDLNAEHVLANKHVVLDKRAYDQVLARLGDV